MQIEVRTHNEDWGCALHKGAHYTPTNTDYTVTDEETTVVK